MVEHSAYLLAGEDQLAKKKNIDSIKDKYLDKDLGELNFETVYANDKDFAPADLDETLSYGPQQEHTRRVVLVKRVEALSPEHKEILLRYLKNPQPEVILILDSEVLSKQDLFFKQLSKLTTALYIENTRKENVFDLARAIERRNIKKALEILNYLLRNREKPLKILGGIYWYWEESKDKLSLEQFRKGLKILLEADLGIKTSAVKEEIAVEMAVVRLAYLMC